MPLNPTTDVFNVLPGLVINHDDTAVVVTDVSRDIDSEVITMTLLAEDDQPTTTFTASWAAGLTVEVVGISVGLTVDGIDRFNS